MKLCTSNSSAILGPSRNSLVLRQSTGPKLPGERETEFFVFVILNLYVYIYYFLNHSHWVLDMKVHTSIAHLDTTTLRPEEIRGRLFKNGVV